MSTRQVIGFAGGIIGGLVGGPAGFQWGFAIGSAIGGAVDPQVIKGPSIGDIAEQTSSEGGPRPIVFALSKPIAGNIIAQGDPRIVKKKQSQGKGGPKVETESVYRTYAVGVCEGLVGFVRIWRNGTIVYDITAGSQLSDEDNNNFIQKSRMYSGSYSQNPDPDLEALFGVGTTPAHRGTAYIVMVDEDLTDLRGAIPQWQFQVQRCGVSQAAILSVSSGGHQADGTHQIMRSVDGQNFEAIETPLNVSSPLSGFGWRQIAHSPSLGVTVVVSNDNVPYFMISEDSGATWELMDLTVQTGGAGNFAGVAWSEAIGLFAAVRSAATNAVATSPDGRNWTLRSTPDFGGAQTMVSCEASGLFIAGRAGVPGQSIMTSPDGINWTIRGTTRNAYDMAINGLYVIAAERSQNLMQSLDGGITWADVLQTLPNSVGDLALDPAGNCFGGSIFGLVFRPSGNLFGVMSGPGNAWEGFCYSATFGGFYATGNLAGQCAAKLPDDLAVVQGISTPTICNGGDWISTIAIESGSASTCIFSVADIVTEICERAGLSASLIDVSDLEALSCRGLTVINQYPAYSALRSLSEIFLFDAANYDAKVHFVVRGGNTVATITEDDLLDDDQDIEQSKRADSIAIPRVLHLNYHDVAGGIATDKQSSERGGDRRATGEASMQTAVILNADEAAQAVVIAHKIMIEDQRGELKFSLGDNFIKLVPSDNIVMQWNGRSIRARLTKVDTNDGDQEYMALYDRQSAYTSDVEGIPAAPASPPPSNVIGQTLIEPLDIHILRDADDNVGLLYYVALSGVFPAWQGAQVELSMDGGANYIDSASTTVSAIMGELVESLPDHPQEFPDEVHVARVRVDTPNSELESATFAQLLSNDRNLIIIGDEMIQFGGVDEYEPGIWDLSFMLRGRKGTTTAAHTAGERFIVLDRASLAMIPASIADIGKTFTFRATSFGRPIESATVVSMVYAGRSQIEREPSYVSARRDGDDAVVEWIGVGRLGSGVAVAHGVRFDGYRVTFDDGSITETVDTSDESLVHDVSAFASPITISVAQLNELTGAGPAIEVIL